MIAVVHFLVMLESVEIKRVAFLVPKMSFHNLFSVSFKEMFSLNNCK